MSLEINSEMAGDVVVVDLQGRLDTLTAKPFETFLTERIRNAQRRIVVDLAGVVYISSYGLRVFLQAAKELGVNRKGFVLCGLAPEVQRVFRVSGFDKILSICEGRSDAIALASG